MALIWVEMKVVLRSETKRENSSLLLSQPRNRKPAKNILTHPKKKE
jgi:hypothetical protein